MTLKLDDDTLVLTVNNRLAAELRRRHDSAQIDAGRTVWATPTILPWNTWLNTQYELLLDQGACDRDLLTALQELVLWQQVIAADDDNDAELLRPAGAAQIAQQAFALALSWELDPGTLLAAGSEETRRFLGWMETFIAGLDRRHQLSPAQLPGLIDLNLQAGNIAPPGKLLLCGFDSIAPVQARLLQTLEHLGCQHRIPVPKHESRLDAGRITAGSAEDEIRQAAHWAVDQLRAGPHARIGIVSPKLSALRATVERVFSEVMTPHAVLNGRSGDRPFNISLGEPLAEHTMTAHGLLALELLGNRLTLQGFGQLLRSPFIGGFAHETARRAQFDARLRSEGRPAFTVAHVIDRLQHLASDAPAHCADLLPRLQALEKRRKELPGRDTPGNWSRHLQQALNLLGWPGEQPLDSREFQEYERVKRLFSTLATLGKVQPAMRLGDALGQLRRIAAETVFQAESGNARVQILGPLEAAGLDFDGVWLFGMDDDSWPPTPNPNPLLPTSLQRERDMPHASAARELAFASAVMQQLAASTPLLVASHATRDGDRELRPSPLILGWPLLSPAHAPDPLREACIDSGETGQLPAATLVPLVDGIRGGTALLAAQANCPFKALATHRLHARPLDEASHHPDGAMLGQLVHELLQRVWGELKNSRKLAALDATERQALVQPLAGQALADHGRRRPDLFTERFKAIEQVRLTNLVIDWLEAESQRAQGFEVVSLERVQLIELGSLALQTRTDRVDRLDDGSLAIIDYKTGRQVDAGGWLDERLSEPQLPLYCIDNAGEVGTAVLARVNRDQKGCGFVGISRAAGFAPGVAAAGDDAVPIDWPALLRHWQNALQELAAEVVAGRIDPTPSIQACQYCPYGAFCRVRQMITESDDE